MLTTSGCLFGMVQERAPLQVADLPDRLASWLQDVGGFAAVGLLVWGVAYLLRRPTTPPERSLPFRVIFVSALVGAALAYAGAGLFTFLLPSAVSFNLTVGGLCALVAAGLPFIVDLTRMRARRVWGLAVLSIKEGLHQRAFWILIPLGLVFLFAGWFVPHKPEAQLRLYIQIVYWVMAPLLLVMGAVLASFSIPNDIRGHTIATIVTKPVERFEIILGRFLGYVALMSGLLAVMTVCSLVLVYLQGIPKESAAESLRARVPVYGDLQFLGRTADFKGQEAIGEWQYRRYISGGEGSPHRALWQFAELPGRLSERETVPCELRFDIFRYRKPEKEGQGVFCSFDFTSRNWAQNPGILLFDREHQTWKRLTGKGLEDFYQKELRQARRAPDAATYADAMEKITRKYGRFEAPSKEITDNHTYTLDVPAGLFKNAAASAVFLELKTAPNGEDVIEEYNGPPPSGTEVPPPPEPGTPLLDVLVKCESAGQLVGMAKYDLYFVDGEGYFGLNFCKGALGLWFRLCLVIGLAVACSSYLSGVVSLVATLFLYLFGIFGDYIQSVASGRNEEGGPLQAFQSIISGAPSGPKAPGGATDLFDDAFRWYLRRLLNVLPDVDLFTLNEFVANGFDISWESLILRFLVLVGYLLPWAVLAYYLMKSREMAA